MPRQTDRVEYDRRLGSDGATYGANLSRSGGNIPVAFLSMSTLHVFPFRSPAEIDVASITMFGPADRLGGAVLRGHHAETGEWFASIVFERPTTWSALVSADKQEREATHLRRFIRDFDRTAESTFGVPLGRGADPPDFVVGRSGKELGVELTQLVYEDRINAWEAMQSIKMGLLGVDRGRFSHLAGRCIYIAYDRNQALPRPGRKGVAELTEALLRYKPPVGPPAAPRGLVKDSATPGTWSTGYTELEQLPEVLPGEAVQRVGRLSLMSAPLSRDESGAFARQRGFDVALSVQTDVWESAAWATFEQRIAEKDRPGSDVIVMSCGAPVVKGNSFPSDEIAGEAVLAAAACRALDPTTYVKDVYLHSWASEQIATFEPGRSGFALLAS